MPTEAMPMGEAVGSRDSLMPLRASSLRGPLQARIFEALVREACATAAGLQAEGERGCGGRRRRFGSAHACMCKESSTDQSS